MTLNHKLTAASLAVAFLALVGTGWQAVEAHRQNNVQNAQLSTLQEQFAAAGPLLEAQFSVEFSEKPGQPQRPEIADIESVELDEDGFSAYKMVWLRIRLLNVGRAETSLQDVRLEIADDAYRSATELASGVQCVMQGDEFEGCDETLPVNLAPGTRYEVWFPLNQYIGDFDMTAFGDSGMPLIVESTGLAEAPYRTASGLQVTE
jgi:hypothetical protein